MNVSNVGPQSINGQNQAGIPSEYKKASNHFQGRFFAYLDTLSRKGEISKAEYSRLKKGTVYLRRNDAGESTSIMVLGKDGKQYTSRDYSYRGANYYLTILQQLMDFGKIKFMDEIAQTEDTSQTLAKQKSPRKQVIEQWDLSQSIKLDSAAAKLNGSNLTTALIEQKLSEQFKDQDVKLVSYKVAAQNGRLVIKDIKIEINGERYSWEGKDVKTQIFHVYQDVHEIYANLAAVKLSLDPVLANLSSHLDQNEFANWLSGTLPEKAQTQETVRGAATSSRRLRRDIALTGQSPEIVRLKPEIAQVLPEQIEYPPKLSVTELTKKGYVEANNPDFLSVVERHISTLPKEAKDILARTSGKVYVKSTTDASGKPVIEDIVIYDPQTGSTYTSVFAGDGWYVAELRNAVEELQLNLETRLANLKIRQENLEIRRAAEVEYDKDVADKAALTALLFKTTDQPTKIVRSKPQIAQKQLDELREAPKLSAKDWARKLESDPIIQTRIADLIKPYFSEAKNQKINYKVTIGEKGGKLEVVMVRVTVGDKPLVALRNPKYDDSAATILKVHIEKKLNDKLQAWLSPNPYDIY